VLTERFPGPVCDRHDEWVSSIDNELPNALGDSAQVAGASGFGRSKMLLLGMVQSMHSATVRHFY